MMGIGELKGTVRNRRSNVEDDHRKIILLGSCCVASSIICRFGSVIRKVWSDGNGIVISRMDLYDMGTGWQEKGVGWHG